MTVVALAGPGAGRAHADGDPASDVLAARPVFLPQDANIPLKQQAELASLVQNATRDGVALRVAIIASSADLGSITELWRQPQSYARFLGQELGLVFHGTLLVVMPDGYGVQAVAGAPSSRTPPRLAGLPTPASGLGTAAVAAVQRVAADAGHPLAAVTASASGATQPASVVPWAVFVAGAVLIAAVWTLSLRRRPLKLTRHHP